MDSISFNITSSKGPSRARRALRARSRVMYNKAKACGRLFWIG